MIVWILRFFWAMYGCPKCGNDVDHSVFRSPYDRWARIPHEWKCGNCGVVDWNGKNEPKVVWSYGV